jgi:hypothetical protein
MVGWVIIAAFVVACCTALYYGMVKLQELRESRAFITIDGWRSRGE